MNKFYVMFGGRELGTIEADTYEEAKSRVEEIISIQGDEENEEDELKNIVNEKMEKIKETKKKILESLKPPYLCADCGSKTGENHSGGCDIERCPKCKGQLLSCDCILNQLSTDGKILIDGDGIEYTRFLVQNSSTEDFEVAD